MKNELLKSSRLPGCRSPFMWDQWLPRHRGVAHGWSLDCLTAATHRISTRTNTSNSVENLGDSRDASKLGEPRAIDRAWPDLSLSDDHQSILREHCWNSWWISNMHTATRLSL